MDRALEARKVDDLIPWARNARTHSDAQVAQIAAAIREWGWTNPVLIDEQNTIIAGHGKYGDRVRAVYFHTSHPGLCAGLRRDQRWVQVSAELFGGNKKKSAASIRKSAARHKHVTIQTGVGYGGHFRAVQGFAYRAGAGDAGRRA